MEGCYVGRIAFRFITSFLTKYFVYIVTELFPTLRISGVVVNSVVLLVPKLVTAGTVHSVLVKSAVSKIVHFVRTVLLTTILTLKFVKTVFLVKEVN